MFGLAARGALAGLTALAAYAWRESKRVELTDTVVHLPNLPAGLEGLRILHVADTHFPADGESLPRFLRAVATLNYDIVFATGDYAESTAGWPVVVKAFRAIPPGRGIYAVIGGHERYGAIESPGQAWRALRGTLRGRSARRPRRLIDPGPLIVELERAGVTVLVNRHTTLEISGATLRLAGVDDAYLDLADLEAALGPAQPPAFTLLLSHSPDGLLDPRATSVDFALSGHTHGGQVRLPFYGAPVRHAAAVDRRRTAGLLRIGSTPVYVSRGFGTAGLPFRLACRPELGVVELRRATEAGE